MRCLEVANIRLSFVVGCALENHQFAGFTFSNKFIDETVLFVDTTAPATVHVSKRFRFANAGIPIAFNVFYEEVYALKRFGVLQLPACVFVPGSRCEIDVHGVSILQASMSSCRFASPRSKDAIDSRSTRWFASDQNGSGFSDTTSNGSRRRITDWRRKRRTALDRSSPAPAKSSSASRRSLESTRICSVDVAILQSFVVQSDYIVSETQLHVNEEE